MTLPGYAANCACCCPNCGSWVKVTKAIHEFGDLEIIVRKHCAQCSTTWDDYFEFARYKIMSKTKPKNPDPDWGQHDERVER